MCNTLCSPVFARDTTTGEIQMQQKNYKSACSPAEPARSHRGELRASCDTNSERGVKRKRGAASTCPYFSAAAFRLWARTKDGVVVNMRSGVVSPDTS